MAYCPILQMRKLRHREVKWLAQGHKVVSPWPSWQMFVSSVRRNQDYYIPSFCFFHSSLDLRNKFASVDFVSSISLGRHNQGYWISRTLPSVSSLAPGILLFVYFAFTFYHFGQTLSYHKLQNSTIVLKKKRESFTYCLIYPVMLICEIYIVLYMEKIKEKLLIRSHTNSSFEGTVESLRLSRLNTYT